MDITGAWVRMRQIFLKKTGQAIMAAAVGIIMVKEQEKSPTIKQGLSGINVNVAASAIARTESLQMIIKPTFLFLKIISVPTLPVGIRRSGTLRVFINGKGNLIHCLQKMQYPNSIHYGLSMIIRRVLAKEGPPRLPMWRIMIGRLV